MPPLKTIRLQIHPGRNSSAWTLVLRTDDGRAVFDRRLHMGFLDNEDSVQGAPDIGRALRMIADAWDSRLGIDPAPEAHREPLGAVGGGSEHRPGRVCADQCPLCGEHLDGMPSDD